MMVRSSEMTLRRQRSRSVLEEMNRKDQEIQYSRDRLTCTAFMEPLCYRFNANDIEDHEIVR